MDYLVFLVSTEYGEFFASHVGAPPRQGMEYTLGGITIKCDRFVWDLELCQWFIFHACEDKEMAFESKALDAVSHGAWVNDLDYLEPKFREIVLRNSEPHIREAYKNA